jgi:hypothetical protein
MPAGQREEALIRSLNSKFSNSLMAELIAVTRLNW